MNALATLYVNGTIRNAAGKLIGFYDADANTLVLDGRPETFNVVDSEHAMDLVAQHAQ